MSRAGIELEEVLSNESLEEELEGTRVSKKGFSLMLRPTLKSEMERESQKDLDKNFQSKWKDLNSEFRPSVNPHGDEEEYPNS